MALPTSRNELKGYCLRKLGEPLIRVNIDNKQLEERIDEAIAYFTEFHMEGHKTAFTKHTITASEMTFVSLSGDFTVGEILEGQSSGATAKYISQSGNTISFTTIAGTFTDGETVVGQTNGASNILISSDAVTLGDYDNKYIPITDSSVSVQKIIQTSTLGSGSLFDMEYQMVMNFIPNFSHMDLVSYQMAMQHLELIREMFSTRTPLRFSRYENRLYVDFNWEAHAPVGTMLVIESIVPITSGFWTDTFLREYATALIKQQWGTNLKKMSGVALIGGTTVNGQTIYDEGTQEIKNLREEIFTRYSEPIGILMG